MPLGHRYVNARSDQMNIKLMLRNHSAGSPLPYTYLKVYSRYFSAPTRVGWEPAYQEGCNGEDCMHGGELSDG